MNLARRSLTSRISATFEGGVGIRNEVELTTRSKTIRDNVFEILQQNNMKVTSMKKADCGMLWRLWSNKITKNDASKWMEFFEKGTEKWYKLFEYSNGFQGEVNNKDDAIIAFNSVFPFRGKTSVVEILNIIERKKEAHRYSIQEETDLCCTWAHSLSHYLKILIAANIITKEKRKFGKKKSFGSIIRETYIYNPKVKSWRLPYRPWLTERINYVK